MNLDRVSSGKNIPDEINVIIEIPTHSDPVKYEVDKVSGYLRLDRPQKYSNVVPALYGFIPQTLSGNRVGKYCEEKTGRKGIEGDNETTGD